MFYSLISTRGMNKYYSNQCFLDFEEIEVFAFAQVIIL